MFGISFDAAPCVALLPVSFALLLLVCVDPLDLPSFFSSNCELAWPDPLSGCNNFAEICVPDPQRPLARCAPAVLGAPSGVGVSPPDADGTVAVSWTPPPLVHARFAPVLNYTMSVAGGGVVRVVVVPAAVTRAIVRARRTRALSDARSAPVRVRTNALHRVQVSLAAPNVPYTVTVAAANEVSVCVWGGGGRARKSPVSFLISCNAQVGLGPPSLPVTAIRVMQEPAT